MILKAIRIITKTLFFTALIMSVLIFSFVVYLDYNLEKDFKIKKGTDLNIETLVPITTEYKGSELSNQSDLSRIGNEFTVDLKMFGIIPVTPVTVRVVDELQVAVLGEPFGMKIYTEGVLVIDLTEVNTENGVIKPAILAGIQKGDYIISVNGNKINTNEDLSFIVENSMGNAMEFLINRDGKRQKITVEPVLSSETNTYKIGIWIRDSSAGIGTLTFYSPANDIICGLGHGICDEDTGKLLTINSGEIVNAEIVSIEKGEAGAPGQLKGKLGYSRYGGIDLNCELGVYSILKNNLETRDLIEIALKQEVKEGNAQILSTVEGKEPEYFDCEIKLRSSALHSKTQNMIITITDEKLLETTGGIVQGMSGSPLLQNGKLIGAVTHVLVDDPTKGYAIFAENMLETSQNVAEGNKFKEAS